MGAFAQRGVIGKAVFLDVAMYSPTRIAGWDATSGLAITVDVLEEVGRAEGIDRVEGDILILRTGWLEWYLGLTTEAQLKVGGASCSRVPNWIHPI